MRRQRGKTALDYAKEYGYADCVRLFSQPLTCSSSVRVAGRPPVAVPDRNTEMRLAAMRGDLEKMNRYLEEGASIDSTTKNVRGTWHAQSPLKAL